MLLLEGGAFLFSLLCALVPCDPKFKTPEIVRNPRDKLLLRKNLEKEIADPIVKTSNGIVEGYLMKSTNGRNLFAFEGIPYAENTAGKNRWKSPIPKRPWRGVRQAKKPGPECLQISLTKLLRVTGSEDCLYLNIYTPDLPRSTGNETMKYPVIVFIHEGSFLFGSGSAWGPSYMLNEDVILVTLNYRLGVMGFLSTGDEILPGNYGLKDQALALAWVYDNIEYFGGIKKQISLFGSSAGGVSVNLHLIANRTRHYFQSAMSSSGTAFSYWGVQSKEIMRRYLYRLARQFGCQHENTAFLVRCLERIDPNFLTAAQLNLMDWFPFPPVLFSPVVEPEHEDAFLTISPEEAYKRGLVAKKPYIMGMTKDEGKLAMLIMLPLARLLPLRVMWNEIAPHFLQYKRLSNRPEILTKKLEEFYFRGKSPRQVSFHTLADMVTDRYLSMGVIRGVQAYVETTGAPTYFYHFSFSEGNHNFGNFIGYKASEWGAGHTEDIAYLFNSTTLVDAQKQTDPDRELSSIMINLLTNFAATGKPSYRSDTGELLNIWDPVDNSSKIRGIQFDKNVEMISLPENEVQRLNFWSDLGLPKMTLTTKLQR